MGFWSRVLGRPDTRKSAAGAAMVAYKQGQFAFKTNGSDEAFAKEGYQGNSDVYACIDAIATAAKGIDWTLYKARDDRSKFRAKAVLAACHSPRQHRKAFQRLIKQRVLVPVDTSPLLDLMQNPNPFMDWTDLIEAMVGFYCITGNTYLHMLGPDENGEEARRPPKELWTLRPDKVKVKAGDEFNPIAAYAYGPQGSATMIHPSHVIHFRKFNPLDDFYGMSPLQAAARRIDQMSATEEWNYQLTQNMAVPPGVFRSEVPMDEEQEEDLEAHHRTKYLGPKNAGQPIITHGGELEWTAMGLTPAEMHWIEGEKAGTRKICSVLGVAPELIGDSANKTFSNYAEARKALYQDTVLPILDMIVSKLNASLVPRFGDGLFLGYDPDDIEALQEDRDKVWARVKDADFLTINDKREAVGKDPVDGGDVILVPAMLMPLQAVALGSGAAEADLAVSANAPGPSIGKAINLRNFDHKTEWWKAVERQRGNMVEVVERMAVGAFRSELNAIKTALDESTEPIAASLRVQRAIDAHETVWLDMLKRAYLTVAEVFANDVIGQLEKQAPGRMETKAIVEDIWQATVIEHVAKVAGKKIQQITNTTRVQVRSALAEGIMEGESIPKLAKRIDGLYLEQIIPYRSTVIARTETIAASNLGSRAGAEATGLPLVKEWISTRDSRTREGHDEADGQTTGMDEPYIVNGDELMFPGDDSLGAEAGNTIQCRCTEGYNVVGADG